MFLNKNGFVKKDKDYKDMLKLKNKNKNGFVKKQFDLNSKVTNLTILRPYFGSNFRKLRTLKFNNDCIVCLSNFTHNFLIYMLFVYEINLRTTLFIDKRDFKPCSQFVPSKIGLSSIRVYLFILFLI